MWHSFIAMFITLLSTPVLAERAQSEDALIIGTPRVVFDGSTRWRSLHVRNISDTIGYYEVYVEPARHLVEPGAETAAKSAEDTAEVAAPDSANDSPAFDEVPASLLEQLVDVSVTKLVVKPDDDEMLELKVVRPEGLPAGEYHSRLVFRQLPSPQEVAEREAEDEELLAQLDSAVPIDQINDDGTVRVRLKRPEYGVPVLIRQGDVQVSAGLGEPELFHNEEGLWLSVTLTRAGNRSLFGDFRVSGQSLLKSSPEVLMIKKYVALDIPQTQRRVNLLLPEGLDLVLFERLKVEFRERRRFGGEEGAILVIDLEE